MEKGNSRGGEPFFLQKWRVRRARKRSKLLRAFRCWRGKHNPPHDQVFEEYGAVMIGGECTRCDCLDIREVTWIGNVWDFPGGSSTTYNDNVTVTTIHNDGLEEAVNEHMKLIGCFD